MNKRTFGREMARAKTMTEIGDNQDYWAGYQRGLRRAHHGESFGTEREHSQWLALANEDNPDRQARGCGYRDGLIGEPGATSERKNITQSSSLWAAVSAQMERDGETNLSRWIGDCIIANLDADLQSALPSRPTVGAPKKAKGESK